MPTIYIGFDPRETEAFSVARVSIRHFNKELPIRGLVLDDLREQGLYTRPTKRRLGRLYDVISEHEMATEFAISRFLVPYLAKTGWALFMDCDMLSRSDIGEVFKNLDPSKSVYCVKHQHDPDESTKMDGQVQSRYARKNWSSFMIFNCDHPSNKKLTPELVNTVPGRDLHRFCWLEDDEIGELSPEWNWLVGHSDPEINPKIVHFTDGIPTMEGFRNAPYADEWFSTLHRWAA